VKPGAEPTLAFGQYPARPGHKSESKRLGISATREPAGVPKRAASEGDHGWQASTGGDVMSARALSILVAGAFGVAFAAHAAGEAVHGLELGKSEFQTNCAACHGASGRGEGAMAQTLDRNVPDLTTMTNRYGGVFPTVHTWLVIDGRSLYEAHQRARGMPLWGQDYRNEALANPSYRAPEAYVGERIGALVDYVATLQTGWTESERAGAAGI
jgi:mono/diheme cytochrome c family protein